MHAPPPLRKTRQLYCCPLLYSTELGVSASVTMRAHIRTRAHLVKTLGWEGDAPSLPPCLPTPTTPRGFLSHTQKKKTKKKTWIGVDEGRRHPSAGSRRIAERGKDRKLEREAERERKTFLPIWSRHSFSHSSAIDPSSDPVQPTSSTAR